MHADGARRSLSYGLYFGWTITNWLFAESNAARAHHACLHNSRAVFPPTTGTGSSPSSSWSTRGGSSCCNAVRGPAETPHARRHSSPPAPPATGHAERLATRSTQLRTSAYILLIIGGQWIATGECQCCLHHHLHLLHHHTTSTSGLAFGLIFEPDAGAESFDEYTSTFGARLALAVALGLFGVADALCWLTTSVTRRASPRGRDQHE